MKKLLSAIAVAAILTAQASAGTTSLDLSATTKLGLPSVTAATFLDLGEVDLYTGIVAQVFTWRDLISLDAGIITDATIGIPTVGIGIQPQRIPGISSLLKEDLSIGIVYGRDLRSDKTVYGFYVSTLLYKD